MTDARELRQYIEAVRQESCAHIVRLTGEMRDLNKRMEDMDTISSARFTEAPGTDVPTSPSTPTETSSPGGVWREQITEDAATVRVVFSPAKKIF